MDIDESVDDFTRHISAVMEQIRSDIRAIADGQRQLQEAFDAHRVDVAREFEATRALFRVEGRPPSS